MGGGGGGGESVAVVLVSYSSGKPSGFPLPPSRLLGGKGEKNVRVPREEGKKFLPFSPPPRDRYISAAGLIVGTGEFAKGRKKEVIKIAPPLKRCVQLCTHNFTGSDIIVVWSLHRANPSSSPLSSSSSQICHHDASIPDAP